MLSTLVDFKSEMVLKTRGTDTGAYNTLFFQMRILKIQTKHYLISVLFDKKDILIKKLLRKAIISEQRTSLEMGYISFMAYSVP